MRPILLIIFCSVLFSFTAYKSPIISEDSYVLFTGKSAFGKVDGKINGIEGLISFDPAHPESARIIATVRPQQLDTDNHKRDHHLRSDDFLDVAKFPEIRFESTKVEKSGENFTITGKLKIKDVVNEISFPFTYKENAGIGEFNGGFVINRRDYHVGGKSKLAKDDVKIQIVAKVKI